MKVIVIPASIREPVTLQDTDGELESLQGLVNGFIQYLAAGNVDLVMNEDGKVIRLPINVRATMFLFDKRPEFQGRDFLVGTVVIVGRRSHPIPATVLEHFGLA